MLSSLYFNRTLLLSSDSSAAFTVLERKRDDLFQKINQQRYELSRIFYERLRDNYLAEGNKASADEVMYELAEKETALLGEFRMQLYGWIFGWGYRPLRFMCAVESSGRDEGSPLALGLQELGANHRKRR